MRWPRPVRASWRPSRRRARSSSVGFMRRFDSSYREMKAILDISENGAVRLNDQELSPRTDFHEWHHYPKVDDTEVAK